MGRCSSVAKKYIIGNPREIPKGIPIKSRVVEDGEDTHFYEGDTWYPGPKTTAARIKDWLADGSLLEVDDG